MERSIAQFIEYANRITSPAENIPTVVDEEVQRLISDMVEINEISQEEASAVLHFTDSTDEIKVIYLFSVLLNAMKNTYCFHRQAEYVYAHRNDFNIYTQYFLYTQIRGMAFRNSYEIPEYFDAWIFEISNWYTEYFKEKLSAIAPEDRKKDLYLVITSQLLTPEHAPTKIALDVCRQLMRMGRQVLLLNLADALSVTGSIPYLSKRARYIDQYLNDAVYTYEEFKIPFFQCELGMPNVETMDALISVIREMRPGMIVSVGEDIFSNIIDDMIPCCSFPLEAGLSRNFTKYLIHYHDIEAKERQWMKRYGYSDANLIRMTLPFQIIRSDGIRRKDIGIPEDVFCMVIVGNRLEAEMSEKFLKVLDEISEEAGAWLLIVGKFQIESKLAGYSHLSEKNVYLEHTEKLLAVCNIADLYINPPRVGGGTSAIYAMTAGKPVVTLKYGDVYKNCGEEFSVENMETMQRRIRQYIEDAEYYGKMSELAHERAKAYGNVDQDISDMIADLEKREEG